MRRGAELVEVELVHQRLGDGARHVDEEAAAVLRRRFDDDEIGDDLALRGQQRAEARLAGTEIEDIGADEPMQKAPRVVAGNLEHAAVGKKGGLYTSRLSWHRDTETKVPAASAQVAGQACCRLSQRGAESPAIATGMSDGYCRDSSTENSPLRMRGARFSA